MPTNIFKKSNPCKSITDLPELGLGKADFIADFKRYYSHRLGRDQNCRSPHYAYEALSLAVSDRLVERWKNTYNTYREEDCKKAYY
ncbi:MAG: glycogen phosphorylase, partial [Methyloprofundus sp.]|nr:glycogen phosphorylase [Methyloprofundus sp.]